MKTDYTHVSVILDRTGSMESIRDDTIGGFNALLRDQKGRIAIRRQANGRHGPKGNEEVVIGSIFTCVLGRGSGKFSSWIGRACRTGWVSVGNSSGMPMSKRLWRPNKPRKRTLKALFRPTYGMI